MADIVGGLRQKAPNPPTQLTWLQGPERLLNINYQHCTLSAFRFTSLPQMQPIH